MFVAAKGVTRHRARSRPHLLCVRREQLGRDDEYPLVRAESKQASERVLTVRLLAIGSKQNSAALSRGYR